MFPGSSRDRAPVHKAGALGSNLGPGANFFLNILTQILCRHSSLTFIAYLFLIFASSSSFWYLFWESTVLSPHVQYKLLCKETRTYYDFLIVNFLHICGERRLVGTRCLPLSL